MTESALVLAGVSKTFHSGGRQLQALSDVSFTIQSGRITGLIGPDGAGKTTLMRLACGLLLPDQGQIKVTGIDALQDPLQVQTKVSYMPQRFGLYEDLSVQENLDLYADLQNVPLQQRAARYTELMNMTGLSPFTNRLAGKLSGGMKQKLGLACTLIRLPQLLILDEPTVGVDPVSRRELWQIVYRQVEQAGMTVLLSTAYLDEAERCDAVILLHEGKVLAQGEPQDFSQSVDGRIFQVKAKHLGYRQLQEKLNRAPDVLDALIEGETVRLVMQTSGSPDASVILPDENDVTITPVKPRFEDAFIAKLKTQPQKNKQKLSLNVEISGNKEDNVIQVKNLVRRFGDFVAVNNLSFNVKRGEIFGLLGANGAGKSTTFRMLCGLLPVSSGKVAVAGHDLRVAATQARSRIGYMAQKFSLYTNLSVIQNLRFFSSAYGLFGKQQSERLEWALATFELESYRESNAGELPLGYKQRLSFAAALMHEPEILFLDEPTSGVDPLARREFWVRTNALAEIGVTVLVTTHFMEEANYCDRLVIMADGEMLAEGTPLEMKNQARSNNNPDPTMEDAFIRLIEQKEEAA